jgi:diguanylate cyclase (GGDEF)-like protein/PAS domain S-box-containing protein
MESGESPRNRLAEELEALRKQIAALKDTTSEPSGAAAEVPAVPVPDAGQRALERIRLEMEAQIGYVPAFFAPAARTPEIFALLWHQMRSSYVRNPMPELTKEKLFALASLDCPVSYALLAHSCQLRKLGMHGREILRCLEQPFLSRNADLTEFFSRFASVPRPLSTWPAPGSPLEEGLLGCALRIFRDPVQSSRCRNELEQLLDAHNYTQLIAFLSYVRMHHLWLEAYPEPAAEEDEVIRTNLQPMMEEEPSLAEFFDMHRGERQPISPLTTGGADEGAPESLLPPVLEQGPFGVMLLDPDYRILRANHAICRLLGYLAPELESLSLPAVIHPQDVGSCIHIIDQVLSGARQQARLEKRFIKRPKEVVWTALTASAVRREDGSSLYVLAFLEDITEQKQVEESRQSENQVFERLVRDCPDGIFAFTRDLICTIWNPAMERIFGIGESEAVGRMMFDILPFLSETGDDKHLLETLRGEEITVRNRPFRIQEYEKEGFYDAHYSPVAVTPGKVSGGIGFVRDITERRKIEAGLRTTEERYRELFENANDIVYTHDLKGSITSINKAAETITGYARDEALQMNACQLVAPDHTRIACRMIDRQVAGENPVPYELDIVAKDGRRVSLELNTHIISRGGKPVAVQGIARDITQRKKTEEALHQARQKLEDWVHELEQRTHEMTLLSEMGDMLRACLSTDEAYNVIVRVAQQIFPVRVGALYVISPSRNMVEAVAVWGDSSLIERAFAPDECWALRRGRVHWVEDSGVGLLCKHLQEPLPEGYLCVPMMAQSEALGILYLTQPESARLTEAKQRLAVAMAEHIAMALSNLKLHESLRSQSIRDPLTGLFNRRFMEESLELELRRAARNRKPLGIILLEVDDFHTVARSAGEDAEDSILLELGGILQTIIRKEDIACRYSHEALAIVLPHGPLEVAAQRAEHLREMIKDIEIRHRGRSLGRVTISLGIAAFPEQGRTVETLFRNAESALQRAQQEGGDRATLAQ